MKRYHTVVAPLGAAIAKFAQAESDLRNKNSDTFYPRSASECATRLTNLMNTLYADCGATEIRFYLTEFGAYSFDCNDEPYTKEHLEKEGIAVVAVMKVYKKRMDIVETVWNDERVLIDDVITTDDDVITAEIVDATPDHDEDEGDDEIELEYGEPIDDPDHDENDWEWDDNDMIEKDGYQIILS